MENAAKALVMAGTVLLSLIVIGALVLGYRDITSEQREEQKTKKTLQLKEYNAPYLAYEKDVYGSELLSLVNKMIDYNSRTNQDKYKAMYITVITTKQSSNKLVFTKATNYTFNSTDASTDLDTIMQKMKDIEDNVESYGGENFIKRLIDFSIKFSSSNLDHIIIDKSNKKLYILRNTLFYIDESGKSYTWSNNNNCYIDEYKNIHNEIKKDNLIDLNTKITIQNIKTYEDYIEFKRKTFIHTGTAYDVNGRITRMSFKEK